MNKIGLIADVPVELSVTVGNRRMPVKDVLGLGPGSVIELDRGVGEPVDVFVNGNRMFRGEVVSVDGDYGIRIVEVLSGPGVVSSSSIPSLVKSHTAPRTRR